MGQVAVDLNQLDEAAAWWEQAARLQPSNAAFTQHIARLLLGAGLLDKAVLIYQRLAQTTDPARKLDALFDLSRIEEQTDHFQQAVNALRQGLAILYFQDGRYQQFFQRLVKVHERFGKLEVLKADLMKAANTKPVQEKALSDMATFCQLTVDTDERLHWLRELTKLLPESPRYLATHGRGQEALDVLGRLGISTPPLSSFSTSAASDTKSDPFGVVFRMFPTRVIAVPRSATR